MQISFGKFIPVVTYIDKEKKELSDSQKEVEQVTLKMCDILSRNKDLSDTPLYEQQRRFFAQIVNDYELPKRPAQNKKDILPSTVKTLNLDGKRYLVTGVQDINFVLEEGHYLGKSKKANKDNHDNLLLSNNANDNEIARLSHEKDIFDRVIEGQRLQHLRQYIEDKISDKTLYISATTNEKAKLKRDKYDIQLIDFKA